jgi:hypothetical protein
VVGAGVEEAAMLGELLGLGGKSGVLTCVSVDSFFDVALGAGALGEGAGLAIR